MSDDEILAYDPVPGHGLGGDLSEHVPADEQPLPANTDPHEAEDGGDGDGQPVEPDQPDLEPVEVYESLGDAPADDDDGSNDEGDAGTPDPTYDDDVGAAMLRTAPRTAPRRRIAPLHRTLRKGMVGPDVRALKRALHKAGCYAIGKKISNQYGPHCVTAVKKFQAKSGQPSDGVYGPRTHKKLLRYYDSLGASLLAQAPRETAATSLRQRVQAEATWGFNNRDRIHYNMIRPMPSLDAGHSLPQTFDCSGWATACFKRAGAADPNGFGYSGYGYTGTLVTHGRSVTLAAARPGDLVFYGYGWPYTHVAIYVGFGRVISHGSESGPNLCPIDYRNDRRVIRSYLP